MTAENANPTIGRARWWRYLRHLFSWLGLALAALLLTAGILVAVTLQWLMGHSHPAATKGHATAGGRVMRVELHAGLLPRALVETDTAYYALVSGMSLGKGETVTVFEAPNGDRKLCDSQHRCARLLPNAP